jgi:hypothetical protein
MGARNPPSGYPAWPLRVVAAKSCVRLLMTIGNDELAC